MPCIAIRDGVLCVGNPTENVQMRSGRSLHLEWHAYFGPSVETRTGMRPLTDREFRDPNVDEWIVKHGGKSCRTEDARCCPPMQKKIIHKVKCIDQHGNSSALCYPTPRAVDLSREGVVAFDDAAVTCRKCKRLVAQSRAV